MPYVLVFDAHNLKNHLLVKDVVKWFCFMTMLDAHVAKATQDYIFALD